MFVETNSLTNSVKRFSKHEESSTSINNPEDDLTETMYVSHHYLESDGRYFMPLLIKTETIPPLNSSTL